MHQFIHEHNPYAAAYKQMYELEKEENEAARVQNRQPKSYRMYLTNDATANIHRGRLNLPISGEIAAVFVDVDGAPPSNIDVCIYPRHTVQQNQHRINYLSGNCDPLTYPLLFPRGEPGKKT